MLGRTAIEHFGGVSVPQTCSITQAFPAVLATMRREQVGTPSPGLYVPRRRPGPSAGASVIGRGVSLPQPPQPGPGLRRGPSHACMPGWIAIEHFGSASFPNSAPHPNLLRCACDDAPGTGRYGFFEPVRSPAKAGAQCRSIRNRARRFVTTAPATGPRPSPGNVTGVHRSAKRIVSTLRLGGCRNRSGMTKHRAELPTGWLDSVRLCLNLLHMRNIACVHAANQAVLGRRAMKPGTK